MSTFLDHHIYMQYAIVALLLAVHIGVYGFLEGIRSHQPSSVSGVRLLIALSILMWLGALSYGVIFVLTGYSMKTTIISGLTVGALITIVVEILWGFIAPPNLPNIEDIAKQIVSPEIIRNKTISSKNYANNPTNTLQRIINSNSWNQKIREVFFSFEKPTNLEKFSLKLAVATPLFFLSR